MFDASSMIDEVGEAMQTCPQHPLGGCDLQELAAICKNELLSARITLYLQESRVSFNT
jgi:hypothetical protein